MGLSPTKTDYSVLEDRSWLGSAHGADSTFSLTVSGDSVRSRFAAGTHLPSGVVLAKSTATDLGVLYAGTSDEVQVVTEGGAGLTSFTLTLAGQTTGAIAAGATAAAVQAALEALSNVVPGDVTVTGAAGGPYTVAFRGALADTDVAQMTATPTGGTGTVTVTTGTAGGADLGSAGSGTAVGHLYGGHKVPAAGDLHCAVLDHGKVIVANLPAGHGLDAAARADLTHVRYVL
jgi:hypothetical protein